MASTKLIAVAHVTLEITNPANPSKLVAEAGENRSKKPLADWREAVDEAAAVVRHVQPEIGIVWLPRSIFRRTLTFPGNRVRFNSGSGEVTVQYTSSPTRKTVQSLSRYMLTRELKEGPVPLSFSDDEKFRNIIVNRASIVTGFQRLDLNLNPTPGEAVGLSMLFTGDAYDRECDLRETMAEWRTGAQTRAVYKFDVIKVSYHLHSRENEEVVLSLLQIPHHGSDVTSSSDFYETFRDEVYLVCGAHEVHGNPKFSSISTIIRGFEGKRVCQAFAVVLVLG